VRREKLLCSANRAGIRAFDFGGVFAGGSNWLEIAVSPSGSNTFTTLLPRHQLTPTPYAILAENASNLIGTLPASPTISGIVTADSFSGDGSLLTSVDAATLGGLTSAGFWQLDGNANANPANGALLGTTDDLPLELRVGGGRALRLEYAANPSFNDIVPNLIGGYSGNLVSNGFIGAAIIGGGDVGVPNVVGNNYASVLGGLANTASGNISIAMGNGCTASASTSIAMGNGTTASGVISTALGDATTAGGLASVAMGYKSYALGELSFAAGNGSYAGYKGSFVWADDSDNNGFSDTAANQFLIRASGGVGIGTQYPPPGGLSVASGGLAVTGASSPNYPNATGVFIENQLSFGAVYAFDYGRDKTLPLCLNTPGGNVGIGTTTPAYTLQVAGSCEATAFVTSSDRNVKENFRPVSTREILDKVTSLPVPRWNFKQDKSGEHIGPMAQDFYAAFAVGPDDKHITTVDEGGIALAAIQGLNEKVEKKDATIREQSAEIAALKTRLENLERMMSAKFGESE
jgi:hypothetical protein